jgi:hypothetical protein
MSVTGVTNINALDVNATPSSSQSASTATQANLGQSAGAAAYPQDSFTPSPQNDSWQTAANDAGIFQVAQPPVASTAVNPASAPSAPAAAQAAATISVQPTATATVTAAADAQSELQTLNGQLLNLGLSNDDIQAIDRIATLTKVYKPPTVYNDLIQQFEAQATPKTNVTNDVNQTAATSNPPKA